MLSRTQSPRRFVVLEVKCEHSAELDAFSSSNGLHSCRSSAGGEVI